MSASVSGMRGGQPSTTQPIAGPWLSPKVVTRKRWPKVLWDMAPDSGASYGHAARPSNPRRSAAARKSAPQGGQAPHPPSRSSSIQVEFAIEASSPSYEHRLVTEKRNVEATRRHRHRGRPHSRACRLVRADRHADPGRDLDPDDEEGRQTPRRQAPRRQEADDGQEADGQAPHGQAPHGQAPHGE